MECRKPFVPWVQLEFCGSGFNCSQNSSTSPFFQLENYAPNALNSIWGWSTASSSIALPKGRGTQPDFSDDDPQSSYALAVLALRLYPESQVPAIKWMHDYLLDVEKISDERAYHFYSICWYPEDVRTQNPKKIGWTSFIDSTYGTAVWRNQFKNDDVIIVAFTAPLKRVSGHKGPDNNLSFRIIGLGIIWVVGGGRTGEIAGQSNLFAGVPKEKEKQPEKSVASNSFKTWKKDAVYCTSAEGSCMGVKNHKRTFSTDFVNENSTQI